MATVLDTLFPVELSAQWRIPLIEAATEFFAKYWSGAAGKEILVPSHNSLELVAWFCTKWHANIRQADASSSMLRN